MCLIIAAEAKSDAKPALPQILPPLQSKSVLSRPYVLLELLTALKADVPIICLAVAGGTHSHDHAEALTFLTHLDTTLEQRNPGASKLLAKHGWPDLTEAALLLSHALPSRISIQFRSGDSSNVMSATVADLTQAAVFAALIGFGVV